MAENAPEPTPNHQPQLFDDPHAPEVFADCAIGFFHSRGTVSVTLVAPRCEHSKPNHPVNAAVVARITMPVLSAHELAVGLFDFLKKQGLVPDEAADRSRLQ